MSRDDIVLRPDLTELRQTPRSRAREERRMARAGRRRGPLARLARRAAVSQGIRRATARRRKLARARRVGVGRAAMGLGRTAASMGGHAARAAGAGPVGLIVAAVVLAAVITTRLATGRSFENMGEQVNKLLLGDLDEEARATMDTRHRLQGDDNLTRFIGQQGTISNQVASVFEDLKKHRKRELDGRALFREDMHFQTNGLSDMLILRAKDAFLQAWNGEGGPHSVENLTRAYQQSRGIGMGGGK